MIEITSDAIERVGTLLADVPKGAERVFASAMNRGISRVKTQAIKQVKTVYAVNGAALTKATRINITKASTGNLAGFVSFSGVKIPLYKFKVTPTKPGTGKQVRAAVKKGGSGTPFEDAFIAEMKSNGHTGVFERTGRKRFPIEEKMKISSMSKGMQRQVALICALSTQPKVLLMDEIFDGLDPVMRQLLKKLLAREVSERNITVMIASHNLRELEDVCDHVGLLHQGGVVFEQELDGLKLNLHKLQAVFKPMISMDVFSDLDILKFDMKGSLINMVIRGDKGVISRRIEALKPVYFEMLPLTLEEVFISEMEVSGYDIDKIIP